MRNKCMERNPSFDSSAEYDKRINDDKNKIQAYWDTQKETERKIKAFTDQLLGKNNSKKKNQPKKQGSRTNIGKTTLVPTKVEPIIPVVEQYNTKTMSMNRFPKTKRNSNLQSSKGFDVSDGGQGMLTAQNLELVNRPLKLPPHLEKLKKEIEAKKDPRLVEQRNKIVEQKKQQRLEEYNNWKNTKPKKTLDITNMTPVLTDSLEYKPMTFKIKKL
jgi:hypothetical protein